MLGVNIKTFWDFGFQTSCLLQSEIIFIALCIVKEFECCHWQDVEKCGNKIDLDKILLECVKHDKLIEDVHIIK